MVENIFEQLSSIHTLLSEIKLFTTVTAPYKENDDKKYYKLTCNIMFNTYYKYVVADGNDDLNIEIEKFAGEIGEEDPRRIEWTDVTVKDCLQDFIDSYEKKSRSGISAPTGTLLKEELPRWTQFLRKYGNPLFSTPTAL